MKPLPNKLKEYRIQHNYLQQDVADYLGFTSSSRISKWEQGKQYPHVTNLLKLAKLYGVDVQNLYPH